MTLRSGDRSVRDVRRRCRYVLDHRAFARSTPAGRPSPAALWASSGRSPDLRRRSGLAQAERLERGRSAFATMWSQLLSRAGCNMGACHGNSSGKGGFRLSLRGDDPEFDFRSLTREARPTRRRRPPDRSLRSQADRSGFARGRDPVRHAPSRPTPCGTGSPPGPGEGTDRSQSQVAAGRAGRAGPRLPVARPDACCCRVRRRLVARRDPSSGFRPQRSGQGRCLARGNGARQRPVS